jgi:hypothetical protein
MELNCHGMLFHLLLSGSSKRYKIPAAKIAMTHEYQRGPLYLAHDVDVDKDQDLYESTFIRTSILNTLLLFECGANCCLEVPDLLLGSDPASIPAESSIGIDCTEGLSRAVRDWSIDFKFIGREVHPPS